MDDDIEHLKVNKIPRRLDVYGQVEREEPITDAYGGTGQVEEPVDREALHERVTETLRSIFDPEIPVNVYDLGLVYAIDVAESGAVEILMTLTAPGCPVAGTIVREVARRVGEIAGVRTSHVKLTWDPPWTKDRMTDEAKLELGLL